LEIKRAEAFDAHAISNIHALSWKSAYKGIVPQQYLDELKNDFWANAFEDWISNDKITVQIMYDNDLPIGCIAYGKSRDATLPDWGEIVSIYFLPDFMGKGYGKDLINLALSDMKKQGVRDIYIWVLDDNQPARRFYEKSGFHCNNDKYPLEILGKALIDVRYVIHLGE